MPHKDWCGKPCAECAEPCDLDASIPCSPDCPALSEDGEPIGDECYACDAHPWEDAREADRVLTEYAEN